MKTLKKCSLPSDIKDGYLFQIIMEQDQEDLVTMIFGDSPPDNWRDNPEFCFYLSIMSPLLPAEPNSFKAVKLTLPNNVILVTAAPTI